MLVDPVAHDAADGTPCHHGLARLSSTHEREMFQSSLMSWSSQTIDSETVEKSQRISGSSQASAYSQRVLLEVHHLLARRAVGAAARANSLPRPRGSLVDVDLVAEQEEQLRPLVPLRARHLPGQDPERIELVALLVACPG